jgi:hypothetical protein
MKIIGTWGTFYGTKNKDKRQETLNSKLLCQPEGLNVHNRQ